MCRLKCGKILIDEHDWRLDLTLQFQEQYFNLAIEKSFYISQANASNMKNILLKFLILNNEDFIISVHLFWYMLINFIL